MTNLDNKKLFLINYLYNQNDWCTSSEISSAAGMSVRSVKTYISEINKDYNCIMSSKNGYLIDKSVAKNILSQTNETTPSSYEDKKSYVITQIIINKVHPTLDDLCDYFCISPSTLDNFIAKLRVDLKKSGLVVNVKNNVVYINGPIDAISHVTMQMIHNEVNEFYFSISKLQEIFTDIDLTEIKHIVISVLNEYNYFLDEYTLLNYVLHLALVIELNRNRTPGPIDESTFPIANQQPHIYNIVKQIYTELKGLYDTNYYMGDIYQASILMMTRIVTNKVDDMTYAEVEQFVGSDIFTLLNDIVTGVKNSYGLDISNEKFLIRFAFHLKNLYYRLRKKISIASLQFSTVRNEYPLLYDIACFVASIIHEHFGFALPEDEISYIALHIGLLIEENNAIENKVSTIVLCPSHINYSFSKAFTNRLTTIFSDSLLITEVNSLLDRGLDLDNVDLIITTEKINVPIQVRQVVVNAVLSERNIRDIFTAVEAIKEEKKKNRLKDSFMKLFKPELFMAQTNFKDEKEAIHVMCEDMYQKGYVDASFEKRILDREKIAPCAYNNIALPHPLDFYSIKSSISVAINKTPFPWGDNKVSLIMLLSLDNENSDKLKDIFDFVFSKLTNDAFFQSLINVRTYEEFIRVLFESDFI